MDHGNINNNKNIYFWRVPNNFFFVAAGSRFRFKFRYIPDILKLHKKYEILHN